MKPTATRALTKARNFWLGPVDPIRLETFRVVTGLSLLLYLAARWRYAAEWLTPLGYHMSSRVFTAVPVAPPLPTWALPGFGLLMFGGVLGLILGWQMRWVTWVVFGCVTYVTFVDALASFTINKLFVVSLAVFALVPLWSYWSVQPHRPVQRPSAWALRVLQATLVIQFFTAGWCKVAHGDWLQNPYVLWSQIQGIYRTDIAAWMLRVTPAGVWAWMQYIALSFELLAPLLFLVKRFRPIGFLWGGGFLLMIAVTMDQLIYFMLQMACYFVLFMEERTLNGLRLWVRHPRRLSRWLRRHALRPST